MGCASSNAATDINGGTVSRNSSGGKDGATETSFFQKYSLGPKLGKGAFAQVRVAIAVPADKEKSLAVKVMDLRADPDAPVTAPLPELKQIKLDSELKQDAVQEAGVWRKAGTHPQIVGLVDAFLECGASFFIMEMCDTNLLKFLEKGANHKQLNERALGFVFAQNLQACKHIHARGVVHRDIKPDNYMVQGQAVKMCDFGLSAVMAEKNGVLATSGLTGVCGTAPYMAPEMLKGQKYGPEVDIWSVGVMVYTLFFGAFPYNGNERTAKEMKRAIRDCNKKPVFEPARGGTAVTPQVSEPAVSFCKWLLLRFPAKRWKADDGLQCEFIKACDSLDESLPSMLPALSNCKRAGVFEKRRLEAPEKLDGLLTRLHTEYRNAPMDDKMPPKEKHGGDDAASETSSVGGTSLASNLWKQSHSTLGSTNTGCSSIYSGAQH